MRKKIITTAILLGATVLSMNAQNNVYLMKGDKIVAQYAIDDIDYLSFKRPEGEIEGTVALTAVETGKNFLKYNVKTAEKDQYYGHGFFQSQTIDRMLRTYYDTNINEVDDATLKKVIKSLLANYGFLDKGNKTYTIKNGDSDGNGTDYFIPGGQDFYVATVNITDVDKQGGTMGDEVSVIKMTTKEAGESKETMGIEYTGLNAKGEATYNITPGSGIKTMYTLLTKKAQLDQYISNYGYDYVMFSFGSPITAQDWNTYGSQAAWGLDDENDYVMSVLGIDADGDWVKAKDEQHIVISNDKCPKVNVLSKKASDGNIKVTFEITPSNVSAAHVRLMPDNDVADELNRNKTLDQIAVEGDATDIKADINYYGEYTFSKEDVERGWYSLLISGTDENGTNVTRLIFHTYLENAEWEIETTTFPVQADTAKTKATKQISFTAKGLKQHLSVKPTVDINRISPRSFKKTENSK